jgi:hypothetical protein
MMNVKQELDELKEILQIEEDFPAIAKKFLDLSEDYKFREMGKLKKNKIIAMAVNKTLDDLGMAELKGIRLYYLKKFDFYHGSFLTERMPGMVFYFADIKVGMVLVPRDFSGMIDYFRFSGTIIMDGVYPSMKKSETTH